MVDKRWIRKVGWVQGWGQKKEQRTTAAASASVAEVWSGGGCGVGGVWRSTVAERRAERRGGADGVSGEHGASVVA